MVISNLIKQHVDLIDWLMELYNESPNAYSLFLNKKKCLVFAQIFSFKPYFIKILCQRFRYRCSIGCIECIQ